MIIWKERLPDKLFNFFAVLVLTFMSIIMIYPFYYLLVYSLNDPLDAARGGIYLWPRKFSIISYSLVWTTNNIGNAAIISLLRTVIGMATSVFFTSMLAYVLSKPYLLFRKVFNKFFIITMYAGGGLIPYYMVIKNIGIKDSFLVYILPGIIGVFNMVLIRTYMQELPSSMWETAEIDGANDITVFIKIALPLSIPVLAVVAIFNAVYQWNAWFDNFIFTSRIKKLTTLQLLLVNALKTNEVRNSTDLPLSTQQINQLTPQSVRAAITMIVTIPIIIVYPFFQKHFTQGIMLGAIKG
jgi:putative aldouronate transport system permease protein